MKYIRTSILAIFIIQIIFFAAAENSANSSGENLLGVQAVVVDGKPAPITGGKVDLGLFPKTISFNFGPPANTGRAPIRLRYRMDGYDSTWQQVGGEMNLTVRFYNDAGDQVNQSIFTVSGDSPGWNGSLKTSLLTHRRETLVVPPLASRIFVVISSAGGPATVGIYVVDNLVVSRVHGDGAPEILFRSPFDSSQKEYPDNYQPEGWIHDGTHPSMAKIVEVGKDPATTAFAILDNDPFSHAEWHNIMEFAPKVAPGDHLVVEWNEMYSIGMGGEGAAYYSSLPSGSYQFHIQETTAMGVPTGVESQLAVIVPKPFWKKPWFSGAIGLIVVLIVMAVARYILWQRTRQEMLHLRNQRALEQERLRIAHDIHDDLGARVTQISLLSAMAYGNQSLPEKARTDFNQISQMSRDLISALYETVWAVNPENDNLDALGSYLCQMLNQLCEQSQLGCRLDIQDLPKDIQVSSQIRHNITLAVKESLNNVIKHAKATEVVVRITFKKMLLDISIQDNGCGFKPADNLAGNGLKNIKLRLEGIGGSSFIESEAGKGTMVHLRLLVKPAVIEK
ncbi:MAG TPA: sensor histidine kinase [Candidatus Acidoferrales bacterium]|jgi:signal transduction histidine kinase|nr:sensor histidine kinase [Candidatus Acidoferrales bacterium]